ncbi:MAG: ATP-binding protein [Candidatus Gracilibacteria bacterium]|nr:ATP-binding protein [Candidatus Gracilibacteria bacterium]
MSTKLKLENPEIFINRVTEKQYFLDYFNNIPRNILFVYGPKSTGKTTLIRKVIKENLDEKDFRINFINLREYIITNFKDFRSLFFPKDLKQEIGETVRQITTGAKFKFPGFEWDSRDINLMEKNIFGLMIKKIEELQEKGIKTVIVLDEFQYLKDIYMDEQKEVILINELFKFFIALTKQNNLAHVVCLTSDSYYMEELYGDTKLSNTSKFYLMEHLNKKDINYWLEDLEKIDKKIVEKIWKNLGGSVWEIWQVLVSYKNTGNYHNELNDLLDTKYSLVYMLYDEDFSKLTKDQVKEFIKVIKIIVKKGYCLKSEIKVDFELIKELVDKDIWFYDMKELKITANSKSYEIAFGRLLKEINKKIS